jgi:hypothetical protein
MAIMTPKRTFQRAFQTPPSETRFRPRFRPRLCSFQPSFTAFQTTFRIISPKAKRRNTPLWVFRRFGPPLFHRFGRHSSPVFPSFLTPKLERRYDQRRSHS